MRRSVVLCQKIGVIGVPMHRGQSKQGVQSGPAVLRSTGFLQELRCLGADVMDYGDITFQTTDMPSLTGVKNWPCIVACNKNLSDKVHQVIQEGRACITLGGDHSIGIGSVDGHSRVAGEKLALLWIDAHADLNTAQSSTSGHGHGMPVSLLIKEMLCHWPSRPGLEWQRPSLTFDRIAYIALRSVDRFEKMILDKHNVVAFGMNDISRHGISNVMHMALEKLDSKQNRSLHVSFDIDSLDVLEAPSTGTPVRGGLTLREAMDIMEMIHETGRLQALDVVEVNPNIGSVHDVHNTVEAAKHVILSAFGHKRQGTA